ncbi:MAG: hypothetical protein KDC00_07990 [Flavobacteriales bacterium]|nr:hypothetical protein [Flavobacteriales bacterium]
MRALLLLILVSTSLPGWSQRLMQRKRPDIIPLEGQARRGGFYVSPGATFTLPRGKNSEEEVLRNEDTVYTSTYDPDGRLGIHLEAGYYYTTRDPVILDYWDVGLAYKNLRGSEAYESVLVRGDSTGSYAGEGTFAERFVTLQVNANKFIQTRDYQFVQLSLGANADYRISNDIAQGGQPIVIQQDFPPDLIGQLHFKVGYGFKLTGNLLLIPAMETPIFSIVPEDQGLGQLQWFSSRYRPLILSVRFMFLRARKGFKCPPPIKHNGLEKQYKQDGYHN